MFYNITGSDTSKVFTKIQNGPKFQKKIEKMGGSFANSFGNNFSMRCINWWKHWTAKKIPNMKCQSEKTQNCISIHM